MTSTAVAQPEASRPAQDCRPTPFPCRTDDENAPNVLAMTLGDVRSPLAHGVFDPETDTLTRENGSRISHYFRDTLGVEHYTPLDRSVYAEAPMGWCSWGYYTRSITPEEVLANACWLSETMQDYGLNLVLLDDGWQGKMRDWTTLRDCFAQGMKWLADEIHALGLMPGLWICPHGTDSEEQVKEWECFLFNEDGSSTCSTMGGPFTFDPTHPRARAYMTQLIRTITQDWGYAYLKLDGIHSVSYGYGVTQAYLRHQDRFHDASVSGEEGFRRLLAYVKEGAGEATCLAGYGIHCVQAAGLCHAMRTGNDVDAEWRGFLNAVEATRRGYHYHNTMWWSDPDYVLLRPPLSLDMARAWVSLLGLTGQQLYLGDRLPDLGAERVDLIKRIAPVAPIRPMDLFPAKKHKEILDLKVSHLGREYDVVGCFNYDETQAKVLHVRFEDLGLKQEQAYHVFDFWAGETLGVFKDGLFVDVPPAACRVLTLMEEWATPKLLSTSRHITQGWVDLRSFGASADGLTLQGTSKVIAHEPYALSFGLPASTKQAFRLAAVELSTGEAVHVSQGRAEGRAAWTPRASGTVEWIARFETCEHVRPIVEISSHPYMIGARDLDPWSVELSWVSFGSPCAFYVEQDGEMLGTVFGNRCVIRDLEYGAPHTFSIGVADLDGRRAEKTGSVTVTVGEGLPNTLHLSDLAWTAAHSDYLFVKQDRCVSRAHLATAGKRYGKGLGCCAASRIVYDLKGLFTELRGAVGMEDQNGASDDKTPAEKGAATFRILADGQELLSPVAKVYGEAPTRFCVDVTGVKCLELLVDLPEKRSFAPHANWLGMEIDLG